MLGTALYKPAIVSSIAGIAHQVAIVCSESKEGNATLVVFGADGSQKTLTNAKFVPSCGMGCPGHYTDSQKVEAVTNSHG